MLGNVGGVSNLSSGAGAISNDLLANSRAQTAAPLLNETNSRQNSVAAATATSAPNTPSVSSEQTAERNSESVRVSSSIGRAASAGQLTREQALEIYRNIARFL